ncbi:ATP-binding protein [Streptomyces sp. NPDC059460]|uniref:ATP-binding protein n=1 Tax=Streptomyces sp. NPDC059460 TaxID=3346840 RepID=UPI00368898BE
MARGDLTDTQWDRLAPLLPGGKKPGRPPIWTRLAEADANRRLSSVIARYSKIDLLCLDEFGYLNLDRKGAKLLFQIFTEREERKATAVATNSPFTEWDKTFGDARLCAAIADRITFRCTLIQTGTESYRYQATQESLFPASN